MFGYVRPVRGELKCKDLDLYRATYCGLCRTMRKQCGPVAPMVLNFDFTFLAILLAPKEGARLNYSCHCHVFPLRRKCICEQSDALELAADESVILAYWQLMDKVRDECFLRGLPARVLSLLLRPGYRRAARRRPDFDCVVTQQLEALHRLEVAGCASIDQTADAFATLLQAAAPESGDECTDRAMKQLLYHLGRWIYLIDARDDLDEDRIHGSYNPVALRYGAQDCNPPLMLSLDRSLDLMRSACALLALGRQEALVHNVLYFGLPLIQRAVFDGSWKRQKKQKIWRNES